MCQALGLLVNSDTRSGMHTYAEPRDSVYFRSECRPPWVWFSLPGCPEEVAGDEAAVDSSVRPETVDQAEVLIRDCPHI